MEIRGVPISPLTSVTSVQLFSLIKYRSSLSFKVLGLVTSTVFNSLLYARSLFQLPLVTSFPLPAIVLYG